MNLKIVLIFSFLISVILLSGCGFFGDNYKTTWQEQAISDRDPSLCLKATSPDTCLQSYTNKHKDLGACSYMEDEVRKTACMNSFN